MNKEINNFLTITHNDIHFNSQHYERYLPSSTVNQPVDWSCKRLQGGKVKYV